ncbi:hypothetical protein WOLCODRAFT_135044 [Wolfiporia cocos MD-104 SS10]|uniref:RNA-binding domain-containing protein n=1 Tax=Wolfiporia cocos (strain MD-104) TaxID=742152 RepID=A0A2H3J3I3_WOLCO|nr:hypothetical protein WOLCODRAFT_135044 [Wolfiporia cocos MD-104 SS10]
MAASPRADNGNIPPQDYRDDQPQDITMAGPGDDAPSGAHHSSDERATQGADNAEYARGSSAAADPAESVSVAKSDAGYRGEKQIKPNKVYIGGLPEHTRKEDLESCFGKIGNIVNIELKVGYGFVEFDNREAAEESVAKYHEGYFMGNKIRVELSHGGGRTAKYSGDPGACFKCGQMGHWARECPNYSANGGHRRPGNPGDASLIDRIQPTKDYPPPPRDYPPYRDDYPRYPPRDVRYGYDYPHPPPGRDYRRPPTPPREFRDYPPPPVRPPRDYDDYRMRGPPPPPPPPPRYESRGSYYPPDAEAVPPGYPPRGYPPPPPRDYYDRYERRVPPSDRYAGYPPPPAARPRTPPGAPPPRVREEFDRPPPRGEYVAPAAESRARPVTPPSAASRYADYPARAGSSEAPPPRYRRRSQSPVPRTASGYESSGYQGGSGGPPYTGGSSGSFAGNGYTSGSAPARSSGASRDYPSRSARDTEPSAGYRRP